MLISSAICEMLAWYIGGLLCSRVTCVKQISNIVFTLFSKKAKRKPKKGSTMTYRGCPAPHKLATARTPNRAGAAESTERGSSRARPAHAQRSASQQHNTKPAPDTKGDTGEDGERDTCQHGTWACTERVQVNYLPLWGTESQLHTHMRVRGPPCNQ